MKRIHRVSAAIVAGLSLLSLADTAASLGFGRPISRAVLGEALTISVPVRLDAGDDLTNDCVVADVYFGDEKLSQSGVSATLLPGGQAERMVRVTTTTLVNEPIVTVYLGVGCKAKITRKFVAFADPPGMLSLPEQSMASNTSPLLGTGSPITVRGSAAATDLQGATSGVSSSAPRARANASAGGPRKPRGSNSSGGGQVGGKAGSSTALAIASAGSIKPAQARSGEPSGSLSAKVDAVARAPLETSRLELDPVEAEATMVPDLAMSTGLTGLTADLDAPDVKARRAAAAALWAALNSSPEQLAKDRQRVQELEERLAQLQKESVNAREQAAAMEARVREAEDERFNHPLVWVLAGLCLVLMAALAWLFKRQRRLQEAQASWWHGDVPSSSPDSASAGAEPSLADDATDAMPVLTAEPDAAPVAEWGTTASPPVAAQPAATTPTPAPAEPVRPMLLKTEAHEAVRAITVEELIDLEQQAEFFVVLGQDDAAVELLESHVQTTAGASPLPYLKLLEIHQRQGKREDYEEVRSAFNSRFNAYAPSWESDLQHGHSLEDYAGVVDRLQSLWGQPAKAMELLQVSLTRADDSEETFDLPAYRELLFLYAVARDLSERESQDRAPVDLLLPVQGLHDDDEDGSTMQPLMATRPIKALPQASPSLSLDLSLDDPVPGADGRTDNSIEFEPIDLGPPKG